MPVIALTGASGSLATRVVRLLADAGAVSRVVVVGGRAGSIRVPGVDMVDAPEGGPELKAALDGVDILLNLAGGVGPSLAPEAEPAPMPGGAGRDGGRVPLPGLVALRTTLEAAGDAGVRRLVHLSSAVVYGAWPENVVPLPEDAPVRPDPGFAWAVEQAEAERVVADWADDDPGASLAVLRPAMVVAPEDETFLVRAFGGTRGVYAQGEARPVQFVHVDDLAAAVARCVTAGLSGTYNVAPDGWIDDAEAAALAGSALPRPALPARLVRPVRGWAWRLGVGTTPPAADAYATYPWVVGSDRLRAAGWVPAYSNEEAVVATTTSSPLATLSPQRRQELILGATAVLAAGVVAAVITLLFRARHRAGS